MVVMLSTSRIHTPVTLLMGGGWGGGGGGQLCVFERSERVGGRTLSVRMQGTPFVVDVGAYRFAPDMHLPGDLIMRELALPTACYEPHCPDPHVDFHAPMVFNYSQPLRRIVDAGANSTDQSRVRVVSPRGVSVSVSFLRDVPGVRSVTPRGDL